MSEFDERNSNEWQVALRMAFPSGVPQSQSWVDKFSIIEILRPFCGENLNHTMLPGGGSQDIELIALSQESDCIELHVSERLVYICKPRTLYFEYITASPEESFFLLETSPLEASGVYNELNNDREELLEISGEYLDRSLLNEGTLGRDENDCEIPIPENHRTVCRYFRGKFLTVAKSSLWNQTAATYDGRHSEMTSSQIRDQIVAALKSHI